MIRYIGKRLLWMIPVLFGATLLIFTLLYFANGDPARNLLGPDASEEEVQELRDEWGLDDPYLTRYGNYIKQLLVDKSLGTSYVTKQDVSQEIVSRFKVTFLLALESTAVAVLFGTVMGILAAVHQGSVLDNVSMVVALVGAAMPGFWIGLLLSILFALKLGWFPASGWGGFKESILPCLSLAIGSAGSIARQTRSAMLEVIRQDYITTAKAKGVSRIVIICSHALRNALMPIVTSAGMTLAWQIGGVVVTETVFSIPGLGMYMVSAINKRDYPAIQGSVLFIAVVFSLVMLVVDILYAYIDPRIKAKYKNS